MGRAWRDMGAMCALAFLRVFPLQVFVVLETSRDRKINPDCRLPRGGINFETFPFSFGEDFRFSQGW